MTLIPKKYYPILSQINLIAAIISFIFFKLIIPIYILVKNILIYKNENINLNEYKIFVLLELIGLIFLWPPLFRGYAFNNIYEFIYFCSVLMINFYIVMFLYENKEINSKFKSLIVIKSIFIIVILSVALINTKIFKNKNLFIINSPLASSAFKLYR
jgi:hypothetical protein